jgi:uncharacterized membrane protein YgcG
MRQVIGGVAAAFVLALGVGIPAYADTGGESISTYRIDYEIRPDGVVHVTEEFRYRFAGSDHHGPERLIDTREPADDDHYRIYTISEVTATSDTGAPSDVNVTPTGDQTRIRIGDPERTVSGEQQYTLKYNLEGALNSVDGRGELYWDAAGPDWTVPITDLTVTVTAPGAGISKQRCLFGSPGSNDPCERSGLAGGEASFGQGRVEPGQVLTVVAAFSLSDVTVLAPAQSERTTAVDAFALTPITGGISVALLAVGLLPLGLALRGRRDWRYAGVTPGMLPPTGVAAATERAPSSDSDEVAVQFDPPAGISPGEAGVLVRRKTSTADTTATLIDLAVRGYLHIDGSQGDWILTARRPADDQLRPHELALLSALFASSSTVRLGSSSRVMARTVRQVNLALARVAVERRWYRKVSGQSKASVGTIIFFVFFFGIFSLPVLGIGSVVASTLRLGLVAVALVAAVMLVVAAVLLRRRKGRLPAGYAAHYQVLGFKRYLETAEAEQLRFEEGENIFSRYLPWAVVFGLTDRWTAICERLARAGRIPPDVDWYDGSRAWSYAGFSASYASFSSAVTTAGSTSSWSSSSSGGGSGFSSSSSSGGGGGGGGGGSW